MKIKRVFAKDTREAMRIIREALGDDAVILSNKRVEGGIELVAAVDYDEEFVASAPQDLPPTSQAAEPDDGVYYTPTAPRKETRATPDAESNPEGFASYLAKAGTQHYQENLNEAAKPKASAEPGRAQPVREAAKAKPAGRSGSGGVDQGNKAPPKVIWSQEPVIMEMRQELKQLRQMLQGQLSGLAWGTMNRERPEQTDLLRRLMALGLSSGVCREIATQMAEVDPGQVWRQALANLSKRIPIMNDDILSKGGVVALMGPTGVGKTTTIAKLAAWFALRHGRKQVALVTTDNYRIGAHEQLRNFARIMDVPVRVAANWEELQTSVRALADRRLVLIDTAGMSQRDQRLPEQFSLLNESNMPIQTYLVLSAVTHLAGLEEIVRIYKKARPKGCIITKLDECASLGGCLSVAIQHKLPIAYISDGQQVPEDLHLGRRNNLVNRAVTITRNSGRAVEEEAMALTFGGMTANADL